MLKRMNKTIALIVAVTTIISTIPVMASEKNKIERLNDSEGGITNAVAFSDGKYIYQGSKADQDYAVYYNDGTKDTKLDEVDDLDEYTKYGDSSIIVQDGNSEQKINLVDGTVSEDGDRDDALVDAKTKLRTTLSKTNKYGSDTEIKSFKEVSNDKFGDDVWYEYTATGNESYYTDATADSSSSSGDEDQPKSQITVKIKFFWDPFTLAGKTFNVAGNDYVALAAAINNTEFTGYKVQSAVAASDSMTVIFTTTEELHNVVPDGFIDPMMLNWGAGFADTPVAEAWKSLEPKSQIAVKIKFFWNPFILAGKTFSVAGNDYNALATAISGSEFTGYKVKSAVAASDSVTAIFTTTEDLNNVVPNGFIDPQMLNWGSGFADAPIASAYVATSDPTPDPSTDSKKVIYYGYADTKGNYIDGSKIANLRVYNGKTVVKVENFNDKKVRDDAKVIVGLPTLNKTLGQDKDYIYNIIEVPVIGYQPLNGAKVKSTAVTNLCYVQKISKNHGTKDGGAYVPQNVDSYYLASDSGWDGGDNWAYTAAYFMINDSKDDDNRQIRIIDGNIYVAHEATGDDNEREVTFGKLKLKKAAKITPVNIATYGERNEVIQPIVFEDFANNTKIGKDSSDTESGSWTMDAKGNAWAIYNGKITMSGQGKEWQDMYRSGLMNRLSVYDDNNLIAWDEGGDSYVTVKTGQIKENTITKTGWQKSQDGKWHLYDLTGKDSKGWVNYSSSWYYFNDQGVMQTGWVDVDGKTYYLASSGVKQVDTTIDGYELDSNGAKVK